MEYTHITVILDRTGSMESIRDDVIGGFDAFLSQQKAETGAATMSLVQFDSQDPYEVLHKFEVLEKIPNLTCQTFVPRASTPLLDAIGQGINDLEASIAAMPEIAHPTKIVMVIITDGEENASREFNKIQIQKMISDKQEKAGWQFVFLSADLSSIGDALKVGFAAQSVMAFDQDSSGVKQAFASVSRRMADYRSGAAPCVAFTEDDRSKQTLEKQRIDK